MVDGAVQFARENASLKEKRKSAVSGKVRTIELKEEARCAVTGKVRARELEEGGKRKEKARRQQLFIAGSTRSLN